MNIILVQFDVGVVFFKHKFNRKKNDKTKLRMKYVYVSILLLKITFGLRNKILLWIFFLKKLIEKNDETKLRMKYMYVSILLFTKAEWRH